MGGGCGLAWLVALVPGPGCSSGFGLRRENSVRLAEWFDALLHDAAVLEVGPDDQTARGEFYAQFAAGLGPGPFLPHNQFDELVSLLA